MGSKETLRLDGRVVAITGGGRGLGREYALMVASRGAAVVVNDIDVPREVEKYLRSDRSNGDSVAKAVAKEIESLGGLAIEVVSDVSTPEGASAVIDAALAAFGRIDAVVNNAAVRSVGLIEEVTAEDFEAALAAQVTGTYLMVQAAWPHFRAENFGRIVNIGSGVGLVYGAPEHAAYAAAKGAILGLTRVMASEGSPYGIAANCLLPNAETQGASNPLGGSHGGGLAVDVAPAVCWLVHPDMPSSGEVFAYKAGNMRSVFVSIGDGYQTVPSEPVSPELWRDHWQAVCDRTPVLSPRSGEDYNSYRDAQRERAAMS